MKCPRQDPQNLRPDDIFEVKCPCCGASVEFWKGDTTTKCPECRTEIRNPHAEEQSAC